MVIVLIRAKIILTIINYCKSDQIYVSRIKYDNKEKNSIKYFLLIFVLVTSTACSLPFLAGDSSDPEPTEEMSTEMPTPSMPTPEEITGGGDPCLVGVSTMAAYALNNKFLDLTQSR
ncbi:MAG: hypothetical protein CVU42_08620 [Chloroflexi bacterium HGW-Chloroflexi-4]|jgi:hypothetical protein|nr:MAG: hypothetical protein CVU42_08620 [Chloroflexi bacterium HGW-Chloroflexi-4]